MQSAAVPQLKPHDDPLQMYGPHELLPAAGHPPAVMPSQNRSGVKVLPAQVIAAHRTEVGCA